VSASSSARTGLVELTAIGAMAVGLLAATAVVLLVDEPTFRRAVGSSTATAS
jgi:hypothetical protein